MRTFNFTLLAVLSSIAMIGATSIRNHARTGAIDRRDPPAPLPDCNAYPDTPVCKACNDIPQADLTVCAQLCDANSQYLFCPKVCGVDSGFGFCNPPPSGTSD